MKEQAKQLMQQVEVFIVNSAEGQKAGEAPTRQSGQTTKPQSKSNGVAPRPGLTKSTFAVKAGHAKETVGVSSRNGHDRTPPLAA